MKKNKMFIIIALSLLICFSIVAIFKLKTDINQLKTEKTQLEEKIENYKVEIEEKEYYLNEELTQDFIIKIAREKYGLVFPNEVVFITENID